MELARHYRRSNGLKGSWDFALDGELLMGARRGGMDEMISLMAQIVEKQLGIEVDQKKVPVHVLIVDHAEKMPVENQIRELLARLLSITACETYEC